MYWIIGQERTAEYIHNQDLAQSIKGFYRVLDLITEQGSGGLGSTCIRPMFCVNCWLVTGDKVVISEASFQEFINAICPGAYSSVTRVNFKALDELEIKPIGINGDKQQIVRLLLQLRVVDEIMLVPLSSILFILIKNFYSQSRTAS